MQKRPDVKEREQATGETTPLSPLTNISLVPSFRRITRGRKKKRPPTLGWWYIPALGSALVLFAIIAIIATSPPGQGLFSSLHLTQAPRPAGITGKIVGNISFQSSNQGSLASGQGIADELQIDLFPIPAPPRGSRYYGWLLPDKNSPAETPDIPLGALPVVSGGIHVLYQDSFYRDLLGFSGGFLITREGDGAVPLQPSLDQSTWVYQGSFPQTPDPRDTVDHFSLLDHLRHLLAEDPKIAALGLHGGQDAWFFRNIQQVFLSAGTAQGYFGDPGSLSLLRSHLVLILDYLDGAQYVQMDLQGQRAAPAPFGAQVGLIQISSEEPSPPPFVEHINLHLKGVVASPGVTKEQSDLARKIDQDLNLVSAWLWRLRTNVSQLVAMTDAQLEQPQAQNLLNDADVMAQYAFAGQPDPSNNSVLGGATQIHNDMLRLAVLPVFALVPSTK
jgi:hypothetical protein